MGIPRLEAGGFDHPPDGFGEAAGLVVHIELSGGPGGLGGHFSGAFKPFAALEPFGDGGEFFDHAVDVFAGGFPFVGDGVDDFGVESEAGGAPFVLLDHHGVAIALVHAVVDLVGEVGDEAVYEGGEGHGVVEVAGDVADADFNGAEVVVGADVPPDFADGVDEAGVDEVVDEPDVFAPVAHGGGEPGGGEHFHDFGAVGLEAGDAVFPPGAVAAQGEEDGEVAHDAVADHDAFVPGIDADVDMEAEGDELAAEVLEEVEEHGIALARGGDLILPGGEGMGAGPVEADALLVRNVLDDGGFFPQVGLDFGDVGAGLGVDLEVALHQLGLDLALEALGQMVDDALDGIGQGEGFFVDQGQFDFDPDAGGFIGVESNLLHVSGRGWRGG